MPVLINITDDIVRLHKAGILERLLCDKTTGRNILWATDAYAELGQRYERNEEIVPELITGVSLGVIKTRARKAFEQQTERTRRRAEVFTPLWIVRKMCDHADETWFGYPDVFFKDGAPTERVRFFENKHTWRDYVDSRRMEITCGEGPFLVSRYDAATGEIIPVAERVGVLDRKLRVVSENAENEAEWLTWALRAFQASYGYEWAGDNLLIARVNLLASFGEYFQACWGHAPQLRDEKKLANIIAWNIWQMDGLSYTVPYSHAPEDQISLFESEYRPPPLCRTFNWRARKNVELKGVGTEMKFDFIIGNPPYQEESTEEVSATNGQKPRTNIFHYFQMQADEIANEAEVLIYPAGRWIHRSGKGMADFGVKQINDTKLREIIFYPNANEVFTGVAIADGISIVIKDQKKTTHGFKYVFIKGGKELSVELDNPGQQLIPLDPRDMVITEKIADFVRNHSLAYLHESILPRSLFGIESDFVQLHPDALRPYNEEQPIDYSKEIKILTNDKAGKAGRAKWFVGPRNTVKQGVEYISEYQVVVSSANAGGQKRDNQLEIIDNHSAFGRARVALRSFKSMREAENFHRYVSSYIIRYAFLLTDEALSSLGKRVPDLKNYKNGTLLDYSRDIDLQLSNLMRLTAEEIDYIQSRVDGIRRK